MFVNFNKTFGASNKYQPPKEIVDYLCRKAPDGTEYIVNEDGSLRLSSKSEEITISGLKFVFTEEDLKILGEGYTTEEVLNYYTNLQKPIEVFSEDPGFIIVNGTKMKPSDFFHRTPMNNLLTIKSEKIFVQPHLFKEFDLPIETEKGTYLLKVIRRPINSATKKEFMVLNSALKMQYYFDIREKKITFNINIDIVDAPSVDDILMSIDIYNSILNDKVKISGSNVKMIPNNYTNNFVSDATIKFWEKVKNIEEALKTNFVGPFELQNNETLLLVEEMYQSFVNKAPIAQPNTIDSISGEWELAKEKGMNEELNKTIVFHFEALSTISLFGNEFEFPSVIDIFNVVLKEYVVNGSNYTMKFGNIKDSIMSTMLFESKEKQKKYLEDSYKMGDFEKASHFDALVKEKVQALS